MNNSLFYNHIKENDKNRQVIKQIEDYCNKNTQEQVYLITAPLGDKKYAYAYEENAIVILSPKHKIIFLSLLDDEDSFEEYREDFIEDLNSISDKFEYKQYIGRPKEWKKELISYQIVHDQLDINHLFAQNIVPTEQKRRNELLISLLISSINDISKIDGINTPTTLLEKVKNNIVLFDAQQTRFIYQEFNKKSISIQGLSGTGKTELLLHKLKEIYSQKDNTKLFFTCHNLALANTLKKRVPEFFNFMKVDKQIAWNERLWVDRAWGSQRDKNSGFYAYLCHFYGMPFLAYANGIDYKKIFSQALEYVNNIPEDEFTYAFDYVFIDERQDFPDVFFELCDKVVKEKIYIAGDIFQDIFANASNADMEVDVLLNRCYRTDPRTLMFAHAIGMGLFESKKLNWLTDRDWVASGYTIDRYDNDSRTVCLRREPIRRFEELALQQVDSMIIQPYANVIDIVTVIKRLQSDNPTLTPNDVAVVILDNDNIYNIVDLFEIELFNHIGWEINRAYSNKEKINGKLFFSNRNNVKGLEFPFVICVTNKINDDYRYRNSLYTMLTRSFIQSYLLVKEVTNLSIQQEGLNTINEKACIQVIEPTDKEKEQINSTIIKLREECLESYDDFLLKIFNELKINHNCREKLKQLLVDAVDDKFNKDKVIKYISVNKEFYCK